MRGASPRVSGGYLHASGGSSGPGVNLTVVEVTSPFAFTVTWMTKRKGVFGTLPLSDHVSSWLGHFSVLTRSTPTLAPTVLPVGASGGTRSCSAEPSAATHQSWFPRPGVARLKKMRWSSGDHAGPR